MGDSGGKLRLSCFALYSLQVVFYACSHHVSLSAYEAENSLQQFIFLKTNNRCLTAVFMCLVHGYFVFSGNFQYIKLEDLKVLVPFILSLILALAVFKFDKVSYLEEE